MSKHEHNWIHSPEQSNAKITRYWCECGQWGWRQLDRSLRKIIQPIKAYSDKSWKPETELTVKPSVRGHGPDC